MLKKDNLTKVLETFFDDPAPYGGGLQLREIARKVNIAPKSVKTYLDMLVKEKIIIKKKHRIHDYPVYYANREEENFRLLKKLSTIRSLKESGVLDFLYDKCLPDVMILFGSASKGEDIKGSDIDIFLQCSPKDFQLNSFEKRLGRNIHIIFEKDFERLSKELKKNLINGIILRGYLNYPKR